jgi:hypothetical protein
MQKGSGDVLVAVASSIPEPSIWAMTIPASPVSIHGTSPQVEDSEQHRSNKKVAARRLRFSFTKVRSSKSSAIFVETSAAAKAEP